MTGMYQLDFVHDHKPKAKDHSFMKRVFLDNNGLLYSDNYYSGCGERNRVV